MAKIIPSQKSDSYIYINILKPNDVINSNNNNLQ